MNFHDILRNRSSNSAWTSWLIQVQDKAAIETLEFLSSCFSELPQNKRRRLEKRICSVNEFEIDAIFSELVAYELLKRLELSPEWSPRIQNYNPDLIFQAKRQNFIADVLLIKSPSRTIESHSNVIASWDNPIKPSESRSKKLSDKISGKANKYRDLGTPLVIFVFRGDHHLLDLKKVEAALFGMTIEEITQLTKFPGELGKTGIHSGILLPSDGEKLRHQNLAAVIYCDWFDTLNRADEGKRLHCVVLHNWTARTPLPNEAFQNFGQITWKTSGRKQLEPQILGNMSIVVKFKENRSLEKKVYSSLAPW